MLDSPYCLPYINSNGSAVQPVNRESKMSKITISSKTGKAIELTNGGQGIDARVIEMGLNLGSVEMVEGGVRSFFPVAVGGKKQHITIQFADAEMQQVEALFAEMDANVEENARVERDLSARRAAIARMMNA